jgi:DNA-binding XRE family transcriptional regulator
VDNFTDILKQRQATASAFRQAVTAERVRLSQRLKELREEAGMTQQEVADVVGVTRPQITNGETGRAGFSFEVIIAYAAVVGAKLDISPTKPRGRK